MIRKSADNMIDAVDALESGKSLDAGEVEGGPVVLVLSKHRDSIRKMIPDAGQCIKPESEVFRRRERTIGNVHPVNTQPHAGIGLKPEKFSDIVKGKQCRHMPRASSHLRTDN